MKARQSPSWCIEQEGFDPAREHEMESIFTVGNGYLGVRGALDTPLPGSRADLFVAGIYDRKQSSLPYSELEFLTPGRGDYPYTELVPLPSPYHIRLSVDGAPLSLHEGRWQEHRRILDLQKGVLLGRCVYRDEQGRKITVNVLRCASMADPHLLLQEIEVMCETYSGDVALTDRLAEARLDVYPHLEPIETERIDPALAVCLFQTKASPFKICIASRTTLVGSGRDAVDWHVKAEAGEALRFRRYISVFTNRDAREPLEEARRHLFSKHWEDFARELSAHERGWSEFWDQADVRIEGAPEIEQALRFNAYHLRIAADHDPRISVGARALSGRAYEGHIFWDVEIFMLPFYIHTCPSMARSVLRYRYNTLDGARQRAAAMGYRGACYAWESTVTGEDVTPRTIVLKTARKTIPIFTGVEQIHVTADVAYGVWRYWQATGDELFMRDVGAEILIETARFWASRCARGTRHYHIRGVTGPDEYHHSVNDNAYTNWMVRFNIAKAMWAIDWLSQHFPDVWNALRSRLGIALDQPEHWRAVARELFLPQPNERGVIEQFEGFFDLGEHPLPAEERFRAPIRRLFTADEINRLKLVKQADVLMLLYLFPEEFSREVVAANYTYYEPITDHGSSLSPSVHAAIAWRLGRSAEAERYWRRSLWLDLSNVMGNSTLGVHPACMGGTWQALVFGLLGARLSDDAGIVDPASPARLPAKWRSVALKLAYRGGIYPLERRSAEEAS